MPTWLHFGSQNPPKSRLGGLLGRLESVLGRLRRILERLGGVLEASWSVLGASWGVLGRLGASCGNLGGVLKVSCARFSVHRGLNLDMLSWMPFFN